MDATAVKTKKQGESEKLNEIVENTLKTEKNRELCMKF
jgi:hypothetical protein